MVSIPGIKYRLLLPMGDGSGLVEGGLRVVSLPGGMDVQGLEVNGPPWCAVFLGTDYHPVAPGDWVANGYWL